MLRKHGNSRFNPECFGEGNSFSLILVLCIPAECCPLLGSATLQSPISPPKSLQSHTSLPCSRPTAAPGVKHLGCCFRTSLGLLGFVAGNNRTFNDKKKGFYISAESLLLFHLSAEERCEQQRTGAGSRA